MKKGKIEKGEKCYYCHRDLCQNCGYCIGFNFDSNKKDIQYITEGEDNKLLCYECYADYILEKYQKINTEKEKVYLSYSSFLEYFTEMLGEDYLAVWDEEELLSHNKEELLSMKCIIVGGYLYTRKNDKV